MNRPIMGNNSFASNSAPYGNNIASYPVRIVEKNTGQNNILKNDIAGGVTIEEDLELILVDYDNQTMVLENSNAVKISAITDNASISGIDNVKFDSGSVTFSGFSLIHYLGSQNIEFSLTSTAIDDSIVTVVLNETSKNLEDYQTKLIANFRFCKPGEIAVGNNT